MKHTSWRNVLFMNYLSLCGSSYSYTNILENVGFRNPHFFVLTWRYRSFLFALFCLSNLFFFSLCKVYAHLVVPSTSNWDGPLKGNNLDGKRTTPKDFVSKTWWDFCTDLKRRSYFAVVRFTHSKVVALSVSVGSLLRNTCSCALMQCPLLLASYCTLRGSEIQ